MKINQIIEAITGKLDIGYTPNEIQSIIVSKEDILSMESEGSPWSKSIRSEGIAGVPVLISVELDNHFEMIVVHFGEIHFFKEKWKSEQTQRTNKAR